MKKNTLFLCLICFLIMACSDDPDTILEPMDNNNNQEHFTCKVDDESFAATAIGAKSIHTKSEKDTKIKRKLR